MNEQGLDRLSVKVELQLWVSPDRQFAVILAEDSDGKQLKAKGPLAELRPGQFVVLIGQWHDHPKHGTAFGCETYELTLPDTREGMIQFLASPQFKGIGKVLATRIVDAFGEDLDRVLTVEPERLATEVPGVTAKVATQLADTWAQAGVLPAVVARLTAVKGRIASARQIVATFGGQSLYLLDHDPYTLISIPQVTWAQVDALGERAGIDKADHKRLACCATWLIERACQEDGHTVVHRATVSDQLTALVGADLVAQAIASAILTGDIEAIGEEWLAPSRLARAETRLAYRIYDLASDQRVTHTERIAIDPILTSDQAAAVHAVLQGRISVLTGGPGTGKTTTIRHVVAQAEAAQWSVAMCAPTGRAAKRMEELTGVKATTVHRLLEARPQEGGGFVWGRDEENPIEADLIICDEWSMADLYLTDALFQAVGPGTRVMLVGDVDQLPPIGPGAVLRDIAALETVTVTRLVEVHRQAAQSRIVTLAHELRAGSVTTIPAREADVFAVAEHPSRIADRIAAIVNDRAPEFFHCQPEDVQVLSPQYKGPGGVDRLNEILRATLNPLPASKRSATDHHTSGQAFWRDGDRVVVTRNDAELDVANGDIGYVIGAIPQERIVTVAFPDGEKTFEGEQTNTLQAAWALTVHKSQGGEWPVVVLVVEPGHRFMLTRELVYTAVTRAKRGLIIVGSPDLLIDAAKRSNDGLLARQTYLVERFHLADDTPF